MPTICAWTETPTEQPGGVNLGEVMVWLRDNLAARCHSLQRRRQLRRLDPPLLPLPPLRPARRADLRLDGLWRAGRGGDEAALSASATVICVAGDGDFLMNGQEFATAVQYDLPIITIIVDNGMYGTIRMHQEREYPGRVSATDLRNPDFAAYARAFGGFGVSVERTEDFPAAFRGRGLGQAGDRALEDRSRSDHAGHDALQDPRQGAGGEE